MKRLLSFIIIAFSLVGCMNLEGVITLNEDGSGTYTETIKLKTEMMSMLSMMGPAEDVNFLQDVDSVFLSNDETFHLKGLLGDVKLVSVNIAEENGQKILKRTYTFADINQFQFSEKRLMGSLTEGEGQNSFFEGFTEGLIEATPDEALEEDAEVFEIPSPPEKYMTFLYGDKELLIYTLDMLDDSDELDEVIIFPDSTDALPPGMSLDAPPAPPESFMNEDDEEYLTEELDEEMLLDDSEEVSEEEKLRNAMMGLTMMKMMMGDVGFKLIIQLPAPPIESNATYLDGNLVTLLDIDINKMFDELDSPEKLKQLLETDVNPFENLFKKNTEETPAYPWAKQESQDELFFKFK